MKPVPDSRLEGILLARAQITPREWNGEQSFTVSGSELRDELGNVLAPPISGGMRLPVVPAEQIWCVAGIDEVGRGSLAGPASVGVALVTGGEGAPPQLLTDSKRLSEAQRTRIFTELAAWPAAWAVAHASNREVVEWGLTAALRAAANRAFAALEEHGFAVREVILDGKHDWLAPPCDLFSSPPEQRVFPTTMVIKGDASSQVVAAAATLAKVTRDRFVESLPDPGYGWARNKGYGARAHLEGLARLGPSPWHRSGWKGV